MACCQNIYKITLLINLMGYRWIWLVLQIFASRLLRPDSCLTYSSFLKMVTYSSETLGFPELHADSHRCDSLKPSRTALLNSASSPQVSRWKLPEPCRMPRPSYRIFFSIIVTWNRPPLWSSGESSWLQIQRSRVRFPALPDFLRNSGSGTGSTQPRECNWGATWMEK
jgi:hypothetical protein